MGMALNPPAASRLITGERAAPLPEQRLRSGPADDQLPLELCTDGVRRCVWDSRWGAMLIEVVDDEVFVNGQRVER